MLVLIEDRIIINTDAIAYVEEDLDPEAAVANIIAGTDGEAVKSTVICMKDGKIVKVKDPLNRVWEILSKA